MSAVWLGWAGTSGDHLVQPTWLQQDQLEQVVRGHVQLFLKLLP